MIMAMVQTPKERTLTLKHWIRGNYKFMHSFCEAQYDNGYGRDAYREDSYTETQGLRVITPQPLYNTIVGVQANFRISYPNRVITRVKCIDYRKRNLEQPFGIQL